MFATSGDFLNMSLAVGFIVLVIFLSFFLFYAILVLRDVSKVVDSVEQVVERVRRTIVEPLKAIDFIVESARPYVESILEKRGKSKKKEK